MIVDYSFRRNATLSPRFAAQGFFVRVIIITAIHRERIATPSCATVRNDRFGDGAGSPGCGVWIGCVLRGRFVKRPYIRFSKLRMRRSLNGFQVRHARAVEDASPYGGGRVRCGGNGAAECNCICLHTKYKYNYNRNTNPDTDHTQPRYRSRLRNTLTLKNKSILTARKKAARGC